MNNFDFVFWCLVSMAALVHMNRWLAAQNIFVIAAILGGLGIALAMFINTNASPASTGPFPSFRPRWDFPPFWIAIVLSSRAVARLILSEYIRQANPGLDTLALATLLISILGMSACRLALPETTEVAASWFRTVLLYGLEFLGWAMAGLVALLLITPWLINKRSTREPHHFSSLMIWSFSGLYLVTGLTRHESWVWAMSLTTIIILVAAVGIRTMSLRSSVITSPHAG